MGVEQIWVPMPVTGLIDYRIARGAGPAVPPLQSNRVAFPLRRVGCYTRLMFAELDRWRDF